MWIRGSRVYTTFEFTFDVFDLSACRSVPFYRSPFQHSRCSPFSILHLFSFGVVSFPAYPNTLPYQLFIVGWNIILRNAFLASWVTVSLFRFCCSCCCCLLFFFSFHSHHAGIKHTHINLSIVEGLNFSWFCKVKRNNGRKVVKSKISNFHFCHIHTGQHTHTLFIYSHCTDNNYRCEIWKFETVAVPKACSSTNLKTYTQTKHTHAA